MVDTGAAPTTINDLRALERSIMESPSSANSILTLLDALTLRTTEGIKRLFQLLMMFYFSVSFAVAILVSALGQTVSVTIMAHVDDEWHHDGALD